MKQAFLLLVFCSVGLVCYSQTHRKDSILRVNKIDSLIETKTKEHYNNKFFTLEDTAFEVGSVLIKHIIYNYNNGLVDMKANKEFLDSLYKFLSNNSIYIKIEANTDYRGSEKFNLKLSEHRANSIKYALVNYGLIKEDRVSYIGYGETEPIIEPSIIDSYFEQWIREKFHLANRRTVFRITKVN